MLGHDLSYAFGCWDDQDVWAYGVRLIIAEQDHTGDEFGLVLGEVDGVVL